MARDDVRHVSPLSRRLPRPEDLLRHVRPRLRGLYIPHPRTSLRLDLPEDAEAPLYLNPKTVNTLLPDINAVSVIEVLKN